MRSIFSFIIGLFNLFISTCNLTGNPISENINPHYDFRTDSIRTIFLPFESVADYFPQSYDSSNIEAGEMKIIDSLLEYVVYTKWIGSATFFRNENKFQSTVSSNNILKYYKRQLIFYRDNKKEKIVWVNCFCDCYDESWKKDFLIVNDGGDCYFNFKINLNRKKTFDIIVNGE